MFAAPPKGSKDRLGDRKKTKTKTRTKAKRDAYAAEQLGDGSKPLQRRGGGYAIDVASRITNTQVMMLFHPDRDALEDVPYAEQGDPQMYTTENVKKRDALRTNPGVLDAIKRFSLLWNWDADSLPKSEYLKMHDSVASALLPLLTDEQRAELAEVS